MKKLSLSRFVYARLKRNKRHYIPLVISIFLCLTFSCAEMLLFTCTLQARDAAASRDIGNYYGYFIHSDTFDFENAVSDGIIEEYGNAHIVGFAYSGTSRNMGTTVAWLDDTAKKLYNPVVLDGRYPEKKGEIALESSVASQLGIAAVANQDITLNVLSADSNGFSQTSREMTLHLVGILNNKQSNISTAEGYSGLSRFIPAAFISADTASDFDSEILSAYFNPTEKSAETHRKMYEDGYHYISEFTEYMDNRVVNSLDTSEGHYYIFNDINFTPVYLYDIRLSYITETDFFLSNIVTALLFYAIAIIFCIAVYDTVSSDIRERSRQIGLLRAVGTTKRQIIKILLREIILISLSLLPFSILISYLFVLAVSNIFSETFLFLPQIVQFLIYPAISLLRVIIFSLIAVIRNVSFSPMQLIRGTSHVRRKKKYTIKAQKNFNVTSTLAKRSIRLYKGSTVLVSFFLFLLIIFSCFCYTLSSDERFGIYESDPNMYSVSSKYTLNDYNNIMSTCAIPVSDVEALKKYPYFSGVYGTKEFMSEIEETPYSRLLKIDNADLGNEPLDAQTIKDFVNTPSDTLFSSPVYGMDKELFSLLELEVYDGEINFEKLDSGEEIILISETELDYFVNGLYYGVASNEYIFLDSEEYDVIYSEKNRLRAGDKITLKTTIDGKTTEKTYTIGAVVMPFSSFDLNHFSTSLSFLTTSKGASHITEYSSLPYSKLTISLSGKIENNDSTDSMVYSYLCRFADKYDLTVSSNYLDIKEIKRTRNTFVALCIFVTLLDLAICISMINNSINNKIRSNKRQIGTLRAVGASKKDLSMIFVKQLLFTVCPALIFGIAFYSVCYIQLYLIGEDLPFAVRPIISIVVSVLIFCGLNLYLNIKKMTRYSAVENIRELD